MKIAQIAPFEEAVPPKKYGGTELVVYNLTEGLVRRGHNVTLFASGDSKTSARLLEIFPKSLRSRKICSELNTREAYKFVGLGKIINELLKEKFDIVHNHISWRLLPFAEIIKSKIITTFHGPLNMNFQKVIYQTFSHLPFVSISNNQRQPLPGLNFVATVYNGIDLAKFSFNKNPKNYLIFLSRMSPDKGPLEAIKIAKKAKVKLVIAAKIDLDKEYFEKKVEPLIDNKQIEFVGEVSHRRKIELLKNAKALLAPIQWAEPFGLFFIEAMACGTPVITFKQGSTPEVIQDKKTGFLVRDINEAVTAIQNIDELNREDCREWVRKNFSASLMVENYERAYCKILDV
jgi:glycosyltransferase involved in cell wall biosynthesis